MLDRNEQAERSFDTSGERSNVIAHPVESIFLDDVAELEPEELKKPVKWMRCGNTEFHVGIK